MQAIQESGLAKVISGREVQLIDYPTVKIPVRCQALLPEVEHILKQAKVTPPDSEEVPADCPHRSAIHESDPL